MDIQDISILPPPIIDNIAMDALTQKPLNTSLCMRVCMHACVHMCMFGICVCSYGCVPMHVVA